MALTGREMRPCWPQKVAVCTGEYFGIYDICGKGASFLGTTLVSAMSQLTGNMNLGVGSLAVMFLIGFFFFLRTEKLS